MDLRPDSPVVGNPWELNVRVSMHRPSLPSARAPAFTLLEVLVALAIFASAAIVLSGAYLNVLNAYAVAGAGDQAADEVAFARQQMLAEPDPAVVAAGEEFDSVGGRHVKWTGTLASTTINDLFTVTFVCVITDPARPEPETVTQIFTVLRPTWSDPTERTTLLQAIKDRIAVIQGKSTSS